MKVRNLAMKKILLDNCVILYEVHDEISGTYEYYKEHNNDLKYIFGVGEPFMLESLQRLYDNGYFDV